MAMVNLKRKKKKAEVKEAEAPRMPREEYSYSLRITLETEELGKLGKTVNDFQIGGKVGFAAEGEIMELVKREKSTGEYGSTQRVEIQIKEIDLGTTPKPSKFQQFQKEDNKGPGE